MKINAVALEKEIASNKSEIIMIIEWIQGIKEKINVSEGTISHIKNYISEIQEEIDKLTAEKNEYISRIKSLRNMPDMTPKECSVMEHRYIYGWTIPQISEFLKTSMQTVHRCLRKGEARLFEQNMIF